MSALAAGCGAEAALAAATSGGGGGGAVPFRGPAADSRLGELLVDVLPLACAVGYALDLSHTIALCGVTWREGDKGATNDMMVCSLRLLAPWLTAARARPRDAAWWRTQLIHASDGGDEQRVRELVAASADVNSASGLLQTALHCASWRGHARVVRALLDGKLDGRGADVNRQDAYGATALMRAAWHGHLEVVRLLLARGADQLLQSKRGGRSAMHRAAFTGRSGVVAALCAARGGAAARALRDCNEKTPLDVAVEHGRAACEALLRAAAVAHGGGE
jgi:hypothetical protein